MSVSHFTPRPKSAHRPRAGGVVAAILVAGALSLTAGCSSPPPTASSTTSGWPLLTLPETSKSTISGWPLLTVPVSAPVAP